MTGKEFQTVEARIVRLRGELAIVRKTSLEASRKGDYLQVARLTAKAAQINRDIEDAEIQLAE